MSERIRRRRHEVMNVQWSHWQDADGSTSYDAAQLSVLMDIRDAVQAMQRRLDCPDFIGIPLRLRAIERNTRRKRKRPTLKIVKRSA